MKEVQSHDILSASLCHLWTLWEYFYTRWFVSSCEGVSPHRASQRSRHGVHREQIRSPAAANQRAHQELGHRCGVRAQRLFRRSKTWIITSETADWHVQSLNLKPQLNNRTCVCVCSWMTCASRSTEGTPGWTLQKRLCWFRAQPASTARRSI